jgi:hypothetical protein
VRDVRKENINGCLTELYHKIDNLGTAYKKGNIIYIDYGKHCFGQYTVLQTAESKYSVAMVIRHRPDCLKGELPEGRLVIEMWW